VVKELIVAKNPTVTNSGGGLSTRTSVALPSIPGIAIVIHQVAFSWTFTQDAVSVIAMGLTHGPTGFIHTSPDEMWDSPGFWVGMIGTSEGGYPIFRFDPPMIVAGPQTLLTRNNSGSQCQFGCLIYYTQTRLSDLAWADLKERTSWEQE